MLRGAFLGAKRPLSAKRFTRTHLASIGAVANDFSLVVSAECGDGDLSSAMLTTSADVVRQSHEALLNNVNLPLHVTLLLLLHRRGALRDERVRRDVARFLVPSVHHDYLPWFWKVAGENSVTGDISSLRSLRPGVWRLVIQQSKVAEASDLLRQWHQVFFALVSNPAFAVGETFDEAHIELMAIVREYYGDVVRVQKCLPPLSEGVVPTRMPPVLVRKLRKLYAERCRLLQYAELFRVIIEGEEMVMPSHGTALLNDTDVFEYYITIPGRQESGTSREERWSLTLRYAAFSFKKLLRQQLWQCVNATMAMGRPAALLMNACVFARNDNMEGQRYREALLTVMNAFCGWQLNDDSFVGMNSKFSKGRVSIAVTRGVLRVLRDAGVDSMLVKCKRLCFGPMRGLLDVCTVAATVELLVCDQPVAGVHCDSPDSLYKELEILLSPQKVTVEEIYAAAVTYSHCRVAARYGLLNLGVPIAMALPAVVSPGHLLSRYTGLLERWALLIGHPLCLSMCDIQSTQSSHLPSLSTTTNQLEGFECKTTNGAGSSSLAPWKCGCQRSNPTQPEALSCTFCVSHNLVEHQWICPHCYWVSSSGDPIDKCLSCGRSHPAIVLPSAGEGPVALEQYRTAIYFWFCEQRVSYSAMDRHRGTAEDRACVECGAVGCGWATGRFEWKCGCGKANSPIQRWCYVCSVKEKYACCVCVSCGETWKLRPRSFFSLDSCPSCRTPHPREIAAAERRLRRCAFCLALTLGNLETCHNCQKPVGLLRQFLPLLPDAPWDCHVCGCRHHHRDSDGTLLLPTASPDDSICMDCGALRLDPVLFDTVTPWTCATCGAASLRGHSCPHCLALHPAVPPMEACAWRCITCNSLNDGWRNRCRRPGCHVRRSAASKVFPYSPWQCAQCGTFNRSTQVPQCERCGNMHLGCAVLPMGQGITAREKQLRRLSEVEALLLGAASREEEGVEELLQLFEKFTPDNWMQYVEDSVQLALQLV
ncbi:hypothetical protein ERJ75_001537000 [Trypanosoma vivax]|nr:hypothetical protein ERJ75_001537000 [Trypanosoma vivax]